MGLKGSLRVSALMVVSLLLTFQGLSTSFSSFSQSYLTSLGYGSLGLIFGLISFMCIDMIHQNPADSMSYLAMFDHYAWFTWHIVYGWWVHRQFEKASLDITSQQEKTMMDIITLNKTTDYGRDYGFDKIKNAKDFKKLPLVDSYAMLEEYIKRVADGDSRAFTNDKVLAIGYTSGTTSKKKKYFPLTKNAPIPEMRAVKEHTVSRLVGRSMGRTVMLFHRYNAIPHDPIKPPTMTASSLCYTWRPFWVQPCEVYTIVQEAPFLYGTAIFALKDREVHEFRTTVSNMVFSFWVVVGKNWQQMCDDIEHGCIKPGTLQVDDKTLEGINSKLTADPERAQELRYQFNKGMHGIAQRIWPRLQYCDMVCTGALAQTARLLAENQLHGIRFLSLFIASTEVCSALAAGNELDHYTLFPLKNYYEWIPEFEATSDNPTTIVDTADLEVGKAYELVATTYAGLTRYRTGDVMTVCGKFNQLPMLEFGYRVGQILNVCIEKTTEAMLYSAVTKSCSELNLKLVEYTSADKKSMEHVKAYRDKFEDPNIDLPGYLVFVECEENGKKIKMTEKEQIVFDNNLKDSNDFYGQLRDDNAIGRLKTFMVKPGTFLELKAIMTKGAQSPQFKMPRVIMNVEFLNFLMSKVIEV